MASRQKSSAEERHNTAEKREGFLCSRLGAVALTVGFVLILGSLLYLVNSRRLEEQKQDMDVTLTNIQLKLQNRLNANREFLSLLGEELTSGGMEMESIKRRADSFVSRHPELVGIRWADDELNIHWSAPPFVQGEMLDLQTQLPAPQRAARLARELEQPYYTRQFVPLQGESAIEIYVPVFEDDHFLGLFIGTYSTNELLLYGGTSAIFEHYQLCLVDGEGAVMGQCIAWGEVDRQLQDVALLHPGIEDVFIRLSRYRSPWGWGVKLLSSLSIVLAIGMGWGLWGLNRVIARRRKVENDLRDSEEKYRLLFSAESDAILVFDAETNGIIEANDAAVGLYGWSRDELLTLGARDITTRPHLAQKRIEEVLEGELERIPLDYQKKKDGTVFPAEISTGTFNWKGRPMFVALVRDITERRRGEQLKDEMLSAVSHEMRTPLTAILGFSEYLLGDEDVDESERKEYLEVIHRESSRLETLINNLLNLQRLRSGFGINEFVEVDLRQIFGELIRLFSVSEPQRRINIDCPTDLPMIIADRELLFQALENLLNNAFKYSSEEAVTLGARDEKESVVIWVSDKGPGIPEAAQEQIFDRLFRIDTHAGKRVGGSGLGLPLVKEIARAHTGEVSVKSETGSGSTFYIRLPKEISCSLS